MIVFLQQPVWRAGALLTTFADLIADRTGLGQVFVGLLLLGAATSLPEIATTVTAAAAALAVCQCFEQACAMVWHGPYRGSIQSSCLHVLRITP